MNEQQSKPDAAERAAKRIAESMCASYIIGDNWRDLFARIIRQEIGAAPAAPAKVKKRPKKRGAK